MAEDEGLSPPPIPQSRPAPIQRAPDIAAGSVNNAISGALQAENSGLGIFAGAVNSRGAQSGMPQVPQFTPDPGGGILRSTQTVFEEAVGSDESTLGAFKAVGGAVSTTAFRPIAGITDAVQVAQIRSMQQQFLQNHEQTLLDLSHDQNNAQKAMRALSNMMSTQWASGIPTKPLRDLIDQKAHVGNDVAAEISDALDQTTDPDQRAQLQALQNDAQSWMQDRDKRVGSEQNEVNTLSDRINGLNSEIQRQMGSMNDAGRLIGPRNDYVNGKLTGSTYSDLGALNFMQGMQNFLLGSRGRISRVLGGS